MTLINASILGGVLLAGLPVLLHMIMRAKPKRIEFPALQLLLVRQTTNSRRMRLRHILLLVLRAIVIVVAVLALTRPSLPPARYGLRWYEWLAFVLVIVGCVVFYRWRSARSAWKTTSPSTSRVATATRLCCGNALRWSSAICSACSRRSRLSCL